MIRFFSRQISTNARFYMQLAKNVQHRHISTGCSVGTILIRSPVLTRAPSEFERSIYKYNSELWNELSAPLPKEFYFKKGSVGEKDWKTRQKALEGKESPFQSIFEEEHKQMEENALPDPSTHLQPRTTEADQAGDVHSTQRCLEKSLFLLIKPTKDAEWQFPNVPIESEEKALHTLCQEQLQNILGEQSLTWFVAHHPIGLIKQDEKKLFLLRARLVHGLRVPKVENVFDWAWTSYEELPNRLSPIAWNSVKDILHERL
ncbi:ribosomal protein subunit L17 [Schizosaccharomyces cryophilus OY26]|uniref:Large ribosomal subunit protein mL46 n=1 Tax=Schizosaccharomyces cryophilus (strain OY26 / ATCC MYA-4695 / CBS 11777 / NBRC 106824 / NRRL Y48691) TaxID=653667 RepID=S9VTS0_SCHCR|nr:ribosomal protein subunit L17 [Schizosaccharomyces cryophilus OY26]EPY51273.1 ribosomal protein subunit L17 [Schizosaccharomyces cryophilus OY26]